MTEHHNAAEAVSKTEVHERIGRNLLLFQQAERWVKRLAVRRRVARMSDEFRSNTEKLQQQVAGETLGTVVRRALDSSDRSAREQDKIEAAILETGGIHLEVGFSFTGLDGGPDVDWQEQLEAMVEDRNGLVHHFLEKFDLEAVDGCREASVYLDQQHARYLPVLEDLQRRCEEVLRAGRTLAAALKREDVQAEFLHGHLRTALEEGLKNVVAESARPDGWTYLSLAGDKLAASEPDLLKRMEEAFGHRRLKQVIASMNGWELREEPTKGGFRVLYRCAQ